LNNITLQTKAHTVRINCDIGEQGLYNKIDTQLMQYVDIANIACGGHAGDSETIKYYYDLAIKNNITVTAHLSYPDKSSFGRKKMNIGLDSLLNSLQKQYQTLNVGAVKFHGALYHEVNVDHELASSICEFLQQNQVKTIIAPELSILSTLCTNLGINVLYEGFMDRKYTYKNGSLILVPRAESGSVIHSIKQAISQYNQLRNQKIMIENITYPIKVDTLCIHSDSPIALDLMKEIHAQR
jgi:UPF0271 protein